MNWIFHLIAALSLSLQAVALPSVDDEKWDVAQEIVRPTVVVLVNDAGQTLDPPTGLQLSLLAPQEIEPLPYPLTTTKAQDRFGITYSPYTDDGSCKSQEQVNRDMDEMAHLYGFVRTYGVDCDQTRKVVQAARERKMRVFTGIFDLQDFPTSLNQIIDVGAAAGGDWSTFHTISIGNELINKGQNSVPDVVNAVNTARRVLRAAGYQGPVVTVDTFSVLLQHPELCHVSDYCAANCHAFFNSDVSAGHAGDYVLDQARRISAAAGGKRTVITETGWPHHGSPNGRAIPSRKNQYMAIRMLSRRFGNRFDDLIFHSAFDDLWKKDTPDSFGAEKYWGLRMS
ncbi:hypothetical protein EYZ11_011156 [Aspergillus tanneri]|uniref:Uncharacterized protein n=1 Tax=Aspergillus tanneri TaxID=1220188 RepID=A0A4S3J5N6_9EURO|nr:hypothetical protein EYZ11_011156 [Aspergillus tanneri]